MDEKEIRTFLVASPRGARILVRTEDEEVHEVAPPSGKGGATWAHVARSIAALPHVFIEVQDGDGKLIRATRTNEKAEAATAGVPLGPAMHSDPETARLTHFANLLSRAYEFSTGLAFTKMVELAGMQNERMQAVETRLERTEANYRREMQTRLNEAFERAEDAAADAEETAAAAAAAGGGGIIEQFAAGFVNGRGEAQQQQTNGAKKQ